jgi:hypothetical protein
MNTITIGSDTKLLAAADSYWITSEIHGRSRDGQTVCVRVRIETNDVDLHLATPACGGVRGRGKQLNDRESAIFDLWCRQHLDSSAFNAGNAVAFVEQVKRLL